MRSKKPVWSGDWPIPKRIQLPGLNIRVKMLPRKDMEAVGGGYGNWMYATPTETTPDAVIYINEEVPIEAQRYILWHELQHAVIEALDIMLEKFPEYVKTGSMVKMGQAKKEETIGISAK